MALSDINDPLGNNDPPWTNTLLPQLPSSKAFAMICENSSIDEARAVPAALMTQGGGDMGQDYAPGSAGDVCGARKGVQGSKPL